MESQQILLATFKNGRVVSIPLETIKEALIEELIASVNPISREEATKQVENASNQSLMTRSNVLDWRDIEENATMLTEGSGTIKLKHGWTHALKEVKNANELNWFWKQRLNNRN